MQKILLLVFLFIFSAGELSAAQVALQSSCVESAYQVFEQLYKISAKPALLSVALAATAAASISLYKLVTEKVRSRLTLAIENNETKEFNRIITHPIYKRFATKLIQNENNTWLQVACDKNNAEISQQLIAHGIDMNQGDHDESTALHYASWHNNMTVVQMLLDHATHASVNRANNYKCTALHYACTNNNLAMARILLQHGAQASVNLQDTGGRTPLHYACLHNDQAMVELLLKYEATVTINNRDNEELTALHYILVYNENFVNKESLAIADLLLEHEAGNSLKIADKQGQTMLHKACKKSPAIVVQYILEHLDTYFINRRDKNGKTALELANQFKNYSAIQPLLAAGAKSPVQDQLTNAIKTGNVKEVTQLLKKNPGYAQEIIRYNPDFLRTACRKNYHKIAEILLKNGARESVNILDEYSKTALHWAFHLNSDPIMIQLLLDHDAQDAFDVKDVYGWLPLHYACIYNNLETVQLLMKQNKNYYLNQKTLYGETLLHIAAKYGNLELVQYLLEQGAQSFINELNRHNKTPLYYACKSNRFMIAELLLNYGAEASVNIPDHQLSTPLYCASAVNENYEMTLLLLNHGAAESIFYSLDDENQTILHLLNNISKKIAMLLIERADHVSINRPGGDGNTPLHVSCNRNNLPVVKKLLAHGAQDSIHYVNVDRQTPIDIIQERLDRLVASFNNPFRNQQETERQITSAEEILRWLTIDN
jgi:ankyrin